MSLKEVIQPYFRRVALEHERRSELVFHEALSADDAAMRDGVQQLVLPPRRPGELLALFVGREIRRPVDPYAVLDVREARVDADVILVSRALVEQRAQLEVADLAAALRRANACLLRGRSR